MAKIAINVGHHVDLDPGAIGPGGTREADVAYAVGQKLCDILSEHGHETILIMENDLQLICDAANEFNADVFVSLHCNAAGNPAACGTETYYHASSARGSMLAQYVHCELVGLGLVNRGTKTANFYVLRNTAMPAALVEMAFISNAEEEQMLASAEFRSAAAAAIARGIARWLDA